MTLTDHMTRMPRPFDAERGRAVADALALPSGDLSDLIAGAAGCSPYLAGLIEKEAGWLPDALADPDSALEDALERPPADLATLKPVSIKGGSRPNNGKICFFYLGL